MPSKPNGKPARNARSGGASSKRNAVVVGSSRGRSPVRIGPDDTDDEDLKGLDKAVALVTNGSPVAKAKSGGTSAKPVDYSGIRCLLNPVWCYYGFIIAVAGLTLFGLLMVFSSSAVDMIANSRPAWYELLSQTAFAVAGIVVAFVLSSIPVKTFRKLAMIAMIAGVLLQLATKIPGIGSEAGGNVGWVNFGPVRFQPAEILKWVLSIWMPAALLAARSKRTVRRKPLVAFNAPPWLEKVGRIVEIFVPRPYWVPICGFVLAFIAVILGHDLGTAMIVVLIGAVVLLVGGFPLRMFVLLGGVGAAGILLMFVTGSSNRMSRIMATYGECSSEDLTGVCYQSIHGTYALASGGLTGVGLGNSREKWNYLPAAHNDFIFAVIGEELGFLGACAVILGFVVMGWCMIAIAVRHQDAYARMVIMAFTIWLVGQALVNIAVVVGILPVMGLPMPFISSGGTALIMCLAAAGTVVSMARSQTEIKAAVSKS